MNRAYLTVVIFLLAIFCLRVYQSGGMLAKANNEEFDNIAGTFSPLRDYLVNNIFNLLPEPQSALLAGMLLGAQGLLPTDFKKSLQNTSTIHIVVVSGQNLTLVSGFLLGLSSYIGKKKTITLAFVVSFLYAVLTGLQIPVLRAFVMVSLSFIVQLSNREKEEVWILVLSALLMLCYKPEWLFSISFQLSFLATIGVVIVSPIIANFLKLPDLIKQDLAVSIAAQLLTVPVIAINFNQISLVGIVVNSLILWTVPVIMLTGASSLLINLLIGHNLVSQVAIFIPGIFLTYFQFIVLFFDQQWGSLFVPNLPLVFWIGYYLLIFGVFLALKRAY